jgi:hypothetical protein
MELYRRSEMVMVMGLPVERLKQTATRMGRGYE